jgi:hypothetical protein
MTLWKPDTVIAGLKIATIASRTEVISDPLQGIREHIQKGVGEI